MSDHFRFKRRQKRGIPVDEKKMLEVRQNYRLSFPNPIGTLVVLTDFESALLLGAVGLNLALFYAVSTGASQAFHSL